jgi:aerobic-type carbon monoxide dehydrogenase small subunit (CoxS/CutS family)
MLTPKLFQVPVTFTVAGVEHCVEAWSDMTALEAVRLAVGRAGVPSRCESGICGTCESLVDGVGVRLCATGIGRIDGTTISLRGSQPGLPMQ